MAYTSLHFTQNERLIPGWAFYEDAIGVTFQTEDRQARVTFDFDSPEALDRFIGQLADARDDFLDRLINDEFDRAVEAEPA